jgi:hypothetical protein
MVVTVFSWWSLPIEWQHGIIEWHGINAGVFRGALA